MSCTPVAMMTAVSGASWRICPASHSPSWPGIRISHNATAGADWCTRSKASQAFSAVNTS
jgi:hypothetical protein